MITLSIDTALILCFVAGLTMGASLRYINLVLFVLPSTKDLRHKIRYYEESVRRCRELQEEHDAIVKRRVLNPAIIAAAVANLKQRNRL